MTALIAMLTLAVILVPSWLVIQLNRALRESDASATEAAKNAQDAQARAAAVEQASWLRRRSTVESHGHLVGMRIAAGDTNNGVTNSLRSLLWYAHAWQDDRYASRHELEHRMRIGQAIRQLPQLIGLCIHANAIDDFLINSSLTRAVLLDETSACHALESAAGETTRTARSCISGCQRGYGTECQSGHDIGRNQREALEHG